MLALLLSGGLITPVRADAGWSPGPSLTTARAFHTATLLPNGQLLIAGGSSSNGSVSSTERYDQMTNVWSTAASLGTPHGGHTATLRQGRLTQFGPTAEVYHRPADLLTAQVFSNPPINTATVRKRGSHIVLSDTVTWLVKGSLSELPDGTYVVGIRPHHISPVANGPAATRVEGKVQITELSGSESTIHFEHGPLHWVSQSHGIHAAEVGTTIELYIDVERCMYFGTEGRRVT